MSTSGLLKTLAFHQSALGKVGQDARAFREASKSDSLPRSTHGFHRRGRDVKAGLRGCEETVHETAALTGQQWEWRCLQGR